MCNELLEQKKNVENRDRELAFLNALIHYLENRDDLEDPNPEFRKQKDFGLICDVIVLLCPLHPALVRGFAERPEKGFERVCVEGVRCTVWRAERL